MTHPNTDSRELRDKIVALKHRRDNRQMDEPAYVDEIMELVSAYTANKQREIERQAKYKWRMEENTLCRSYLRYDNPHQRMLKQYAELKALGGTN